MTKVWFITGASRGLGLAIARAALKAGEDVVATGRRMEDVVAALTNSAATDRWMATSLDVTDPLQAEAAVDHAMARFGRIDVLVNSAGYGQVGTFETLTPEQVERQFATNLFGLMNVTRAVLPQLRKQRFGHIFNLSSMGGVAGMGGAPAYTASKFAVEGFSEDMAIDLAPFGIKVTIVQPGSFRTDFLDEKSIRFGERDIAEYAETDAVQRAAFGGRSHRQPGDPVKLGQALVEAVAADEPPLRLALGTDVVARTRDTLQRRLDELERWERLSASTDYPDEVVR